MQQLDHELQRYAVTVAQCGRWSTHAARIVETLHQPLRVLELACAAR